MIRGNSIYSKINLVWDFDELYEFGDNIGRVDAFEDYIRTATQTLAKAFHYLLLNNTPVVTGNLRKGWGGDNLKFEVIKLKTGFVVRFKNNARNDKGYPYAFDVNYGHMVKNVKGGDYLEVKNRKKVKSPYVWQENTSNMYVYGHFFVERSIVNMENTNKLESIIYHELEKWWEWC